MSGIDWMDEQTVFLYSIRAGAREFMSKCCRRPVFQPVSGCHCPENRMQLPQPLECVEFFSIPRYSLGLFPSHTRLDAGVGVSFIRP
jgi:hypothetical protein